MAFARCRGRYLTWREEHYLNDLVEIIKLLPNKSQYRSIIQENPNITLGIVLANPDVPFRYEYISDDITREIVKAYPDKPWTYDSVSERTPREIIRTNTQVPWEYDAVSETQIYMGDSLQ